ncbi:MAG: class C sortase [Lachnospiraceae bacterium]
MKNWMLNGLIVFLLITGLGTIFYPLVTSYLVEREAQEIIRDFKEISEKEQSQDQNADEEEAVIAGIDLSRLYSDMQEYNEEIYDVGQADLTDPFSYETPAFDLKEYGIRNDVFGYISIPRMKVELPILLGASTENMAKGAVNLGMTSIPIGGDNTNAVLAGHRGYGGAAMFRNIELLKEGDLIYITNLWETLTYEVAEIKVIMPTEINEVYIQEGRDLVTLLTCHPYTHNYQRYVVYCDRISGTEIEKQAQSEAGDTGLELKYVFKMDELSSSQQKIFMEYWLPIGVGILLVMIVLIWAARKCHNKSIKKENANEGNRHSKKN